MSYTKWLARGIEGSSVTLFYKETSVINIPNPWSTENDWN